MLGQDYLEVSKLVAMISSYRNIVLIDDDAINNLLNRQFITFCLPQSHIMTFQDARLVVQYLSEGKIARPDLILLDVNMPEMDAWEFLYHFDSLGLDTDVVILSSSMHFDDVERAKRYDSVRCYIHKPLTEEKIQYYLIEHRFDEIEVD